MVRFSLSRRALVRAVSFLTAAFLVLGGFLLAQGEQLRWTRQQQALEGQHAFAELTTAVTELDTALQKGLYAATAPMLTTVLSEVYAKSQMAQMALGDIPYANVELEQTAAFLAKAGDYACALSRSAARSGGISGEEREGLAGLSAAAAELSGRLSEIQTGLTEGSLSLESLEQATARLSEAAGDAGAAVAGTTFQTMEEEFPEVPTLIYDGPFSQHLTQRTPLGLEGLDEVTQEQARQAAADFLGVRPEVFTLSSQSQGELPAYAFTAALDGGETYVEVTRQGGRVLELFTSRAMGEERLSFEEGVAAADRFLTERGFAGMEHSYYIDQEGLLTVHYAYAQDGVVCYPDLMKVSVALDTGKVVGYEASGYWWNHRARELPAPAVPEAEARAGVSPLLTVRSCRLAVIPTPGEHETLCYELACRDPEGRNCLVYLDTQTGEEVHILILIESENGTLAL